MGKPRPTALAIALRAFFLEHLPLVRGLSPNTVLSYRDAFVLLLRFLAVHHGCRIVDLDLNHLSPEDLIAFLEHLETKRQSGIATRNARLAAVHSFAKFVPTRLPECLEMCQRLLAVPIKRGRKPIVEYLEGDEVRGMLEAADRSEIDGRRDHAIVLFLFNTGARVQEVLNVTPHDIQLERPFQVRIRGKGRKERICPLWPQTAEILRGIIREAGVPEHSTERLFRNHRGEPLTRFGVRYILRKCARLASVSTPSLSDRRIHPHILRHSAAVHLLQAGVDLASICHWLGHASPETTNRYLSIDLETKRAALEMAGPVVSDAETLKTWRTDDNILTWLESL
jgi:integrase/recombinase XerD